MPTWKREPQEVTGQHRFDGRALMTQGIQNEVGRAAVLRLETMLHEAVREEDGLDYLQVFTSDEGHRVWVIDDGEHYTWLLPSEY